MLKAVDPRIGCFVILDDLEPELHSIKCAQAQNPR